MEVEAGFGGAAEPPLVGILTYIAQHNAATAILAGGASFAGAVLFFHTIIAT
ncbi:hypothetical protein ACH4GM_40895 [Streptomyces coeruleorubidus]|uniref:hypothetical protein n=1 Tax=Streptomyces coeruleorubidus TaxID=116188 RepID=UPI0037947A27